MVNHFQEKANNVIESICDQHTKLKQCIASEPRLETSFRTCASGDFEIAWLPGGSRFQDLQMFCVGLATVMPTTSRVEGDFSLVNYRKNDHCSNLSDFALEGVMHSHQLRELQNAVDNLE